MELDFGGAIQAGSRAASGLIDQQLKEDADARAADRKLADAERLLAIQESMKNRAAERFSAVARTKMGEQVPVDAAPVTELGPASAKAAGLQDGMQGNYKQMRAQFAGVLENPKATEEQKQQAQEIIAQLDAQAAGQADVNAKATGGKMRNRTAQEAARAAMEETFLNDPAAYVAGAGLIHAGGKDDLEERKLASKEKIERDRLEQKDRSDDKRFDAMMARIENGFGGGKGGAPTALMQNAEYLKNLGYTPDKIEKFIFEKKEISIEDIAAKLMAGDKFGDMTPEQAAQKAVALRASIERLSSKPTPGTPGAAPAPANRPPLSAFKK